MSDLATREHCASEPAPDLWKSVPFDFAFSVLAVILAGALHYFGFMP